MSWFRSHARLGSCLALFALAFQLAVSFGHVHVHGNASHRNALITDGAAISAVSHADQARSAPAPAHPAGDRSQGDEYCPICALIQLARALVPAEAPPVPLPSLFGQLRYEAAVAFEMTASQHTLFRARAPPTA
jgi:hypothetical protein